MRNYEPRLEIVFSKFSNQHSIFAPVYKRDREQLSGAGADAERYGYFSGGRLLKASN